LTLNEMECIDALGGGDLPDLIKQKIIRIAHEYDQNETKSDALKRLGTAVYLCK